MKAQHTFTVPESEAEQRLDRLLVLRGIARGRRHARALFDADCVRVNDHRVAKSQPVAPGDEVVVELEIDHDHAHPEPDAPLRILLERPELVVVDKPAGQHTAALSSRDRGTLANALVGRYPEMRAVGYEPREPGLLHRLDTHTSGVVLAARRPDAFDALRAALVQGAISKRYLAFVAGAGLADEDTVCQPLRPHPTDRRRVIACTVEEAATAARAATTRWRVIERGAEFTLVELEASRAYRHQIRVHLAGLGFPILGDRLYGGPPSAELGPRHALHASSLAWPGSEVMRGFQAEAALPAELEALRSSAQVR